jgi:hypothetical protein
VGGAELIREIIFVVRWGINLDRKIILSIEIGSVDVFLEQNAITLDWNGS